MMMRKEESSSFSWNLVNIMEDNDNDDCHVYDDDDEGDENCYL